MKLYHSNIAAMMYREQANGQTDGAGNPDAIDPAQITAQNSQQSVPVLKSWAEQGAKQGKEILKALSESTSKVRDIFLSVAPQIAGTPSMEDWLTGYRSNYPEATAKQRASEARRVLMACTVTAKEFVVGLDEKTKQPIKETKSGMDWLKGYDGSFAGFIDLARKIAPANGQGSGGGAKQRTKLTDKQVQSMQESAKLASAGQAMATIGILSDSMTQMPKFEEILLRQMAQQAERIEVKSKDEGFVKFASKLRHEILSRLNEIALSDAKATQTTTGNTQQQEKVAELAQQAAEHVEVPAPAEAKAA